ncbi:MAG: hydantoinase B/oxoprolinase family protein [Pseudomonadota bacterium]
MKEIDPITLAVVRGRLTQIAEEMDVVLMKAAFSQIIAEQRDLSSGVYAAWTGETIAQGPRGLPIFNATMQYACQALLKAFDPKEFQPEDIFMFNDPYIGGTHLPDMKLFKPFFYEGKYIALLANTGHWMDIGGPNPGGFQPDSTSAYADGIRIPPIKLFDKGKMNNEVLDVVFANVRNPEDRKADLWAQFAGLNAGETRLKALVDEYGPELILSCFEELFNRSEKQMRANIREIPDGTYSYTDYLDNDGYVDHPVKLHLDITIKGDTMFFDFSKSDPPNKGATNIGRFTTISVCHLAIKHIYPEVPINGGCFRVLDFNIPETTFVGAKHPVSTGSYLEPVLRVVDVVFGCMAQAVPERTPAACFGTNFVMTVASQRPDRTFDMVLYPGAGGYGGTRQTDGLTHGTTPISMANFPVAEAAEQICPILTEFVRVREDSAGPGFHRGGFGTSFALRMLSDGVIISSAADRSDMKPFGVVGGKSAASLKIVFHRKDGDFVMPMRSKGVLTLNKDEIIECDTPGGGGYGDPLRRDPLTVLQEVIRGFIRIRSAWEDYGVKIETKEGSDGEVIYSLNKEETLQRRQQLSKQGH